MDRRREQSNNQADHGEVRRRARQPILLTTFQMGRREPRQEGDRGPEQPHLLDDAFHDSVETPAWAKVAISRRMAAAALTIGNARALPVASPRRMPRSSSGVPPRAARARSCPASAERWEKTRAGRTDGSRRT